MSNKKSSAMSNKMTDFRIAFQGGGANLVTLLAAASAVYDLHNDKNVNFIVDKVSGTSAGSIAAGILATGLDPKEVLKHLKENGEKRRKQIIKIPNLPGFLPKVWALGGKAVSVADGNPFLKYDDLAKFIAEILCLGEMANDSRLKDVKIPLLVTATDIMGGGVKCWDSQIDQDCDENLTSIIADSCAFPVVFKSISKSGDPRYIDGGLVENLPLTSLLEGYPKQRVIGITFKPPKENEVVLDSIHNYLGAILSAIIGSNVRNSAKEIPPNNLIELRREFETFDFARALKEGLGAHFCGIKETTQKKMLEIIDKENTIRYKVAESRFSRNYDAGVSAQAIYGIFETPNTEVNHFEVEYTLDSLRHESDDRYTLFNQIESRYKIKKPQGDMETLVFSIHLYSVSEDISLVSNEIDVSEIDGTPINFTPSVGPSTKMADAYSIPVYLYIDIVDLPEDCEFIVVKHFDHLPCFLPRFLSPFSINTSNRDKINTLDYENFGLVCSRDNFKKITWIVHMPNSSLELCGFGPLRHLDVKSVKYNRFVEGELRTDLRLPNCPIDFSSVKWESTEISHKGSAAGFQIFDKQSSDCE